MGNIDAAVDSLVESEMYVEELTEDLVDAISNALQAYDSEPENDEMRFESGREIDIDTVRRAMRPTLSTDKIEAGAEVETKGTSRGSSAVVYCDGERAWIYDALKYDEDSPSQNAFYVYNLTVLKAAVPEVEDYVKVYCPSEAQSRHGVISCLHPRGPEHEQYRISLSAAGCIDCNRNAFAIICKGNAK